MGRYDFPHRKSLRLQGYDYSQAGAYFITNCVEDKLCIFGRVENEHMNLSPIGHLVADWCTRIPDRFTGVEVDCFVVMPNHTHAIIVLPDRTDYSDLRTIRSGEVSSPKSQIYIPHNGGTVPSPTRKGAIIMPPTAHPDQHLGTIMAWFKYLSTKSVTAMNNGNLYRFWQRGYHDHIIRDEDDLRRIRQYIENNPLKWELDRYYRKQ